MSHSKSGDDLPRSPAERKRYERFGSCGYLPEYADLAYSILADSDTAKTKSHVCLEIQCGRDTLHRWMKKHPEFKQAIDDGLAIGAAKWRDRIARHSFEPQSTVNNGLIKLLSANVYGIKEDPAIVIHNSNVQGDPEEELKARGIPIPEIGVDDVTEQKPEEDDGSNG